MSGSSGQTSYLTYWWGSGPRRHPQGLLRHLGTYLSERRAETVHHLYDNNWNGNDVFSTCTSLLCHFNALLCCVCVELGEICADISVLQCPDVRTGHG